MADRKIAYAASAAFTLGLATTPLASSSSFTTGRESTSVNNTSTKYLDYLVAGKVTTGTTPTAGQIQVWVYASFNDVPTFPDALDGTDSDETLASADIRDAEIKLAAVVVTNTTSNTTYWFAPFSVADLFGGRMPKHFGLFVTHNTGVALNATAGNHGFDYTPIYETIT